MPLSEYEQRVLEQMERQLHADDPKLANSLENPGTRQVARPWRYVLGVLGCAAGLGLLLLGVAQQESWIGVIGFVVMFASVLVMVSRPRTKGPHGVVDPETATVKPRKQKNRRSSFTQNLEDRWDRRRRERGL